MTGVLTGIKRKAGIAYRLVVGRLPDRVSRWLRPPSRRFSPADVPPPVTAPSGEARLYVAPANFAAQGYRWARSAERLPGVGAVNMQYRTRGDFGFPADYSVPEMVFTSSGDWGRRQRDAVAERFTHVLIEAERHLFGLAFQGFVEREAIWLRDRGLAVGLASLGTDLRLPSRHAQVDKWSPFRDADQDWIRALEARALKNRQLFARLDAPSFVATPELLLDWPAASWLPIVVDPAEWKAEREALSGGTPVVLHAPTNPAVKGTALIEPIVNRLSDEKVVDYQRIVKVPANEMPGRYSDADIVLDQFTLGIYATTSIEAMAAGRLVIAHLHDQVRDHIQQVSGREVPVVEATPDTLEEVLRDVAERPEAYRPIANAGPAFVEAVHNGELSARVLAPFLGRTP
ncbi:glycosyltransferase [Agromyces sp. NPDC055658]